jgi:hypothetical protein
MRELTIAQINEKINRLLQNNIIGSKKFQEGYPNETKRSKELSLKLSILGRLAKRVKTNENITRQNRTTNSS